MTSLQQKIEQNRQQALEKQRLKKAQATPQFRNRQDYLTSKVNNKLSHEAVTPNFLEKCLQQHCRSEFTPLPYETSTKLPKENISSKDSVANFADVSENVTSDVTTPKPGKKFNICSKSMKRTLPINKKRLFDEENKLLEEGSTKSTEKLLKFPLRDLTDEDFSTFFENENLSTNTKPPDPKKLKISPKSKDSENYQTLSTISSLSSFDSSEIGFSDTVPEVLLKSKSNMGKITGPYYNQFTKKKICIDEKHYYHSTQFKNNVNQNPSVKSITQEMIRGNDESVDDSCQNIELSDINFTENKTTTENLSATLVNEKTPIMTFDLPNTCNLSETYMNTQAFNEILPTGEVQRSKEGSISYIQTQDLDELIHSDGPERTSNFDSNSNSCSTLSLSTITTSKLQSNVNSRKNSCNLATLADDDDFQNLTLQNNCNLDQNSSQLTDISLPSLSPEDSEIHTKTNFETLCTQDFANFEVDCENDNDNFNDDNTLLTCDFSLEEETSGALSKSDPDSFEKELMKVAIDLDSTPRQEVNGNDLLAKKLTPEQKRLVDNNRRRAQERKLQRQKSNNVT